MSSLEKLWRRLLKHLAHDLIVEATNECSQRAEKRWSEKLEEARSVTKEVMEKCLSAIAEKKRAGYDEEVYQVIVTMPFRLGTSIQHDDRVREFISEEMAWRVKKEVQHARFVSRFTEPAKP